MRRQIPEAAKRAATTSAVAVAVALLSAGAARAQTIEQIAGQGPGSFDLERLRPALDAGGILDVEGGGVGGAQAALWVNVAVDPLTVRFQGKNTALVDERVSAHLVGSLALGESFMLGVEVPGVIFQSGPAVAPGIVGKNPVAVAGLDDVRVTPKLAFLQQKDGAALDVAASLHTTLPTSFPRHQYIGDGLPTLTPELDLSRAFGALRVAGDVGFLFRAPSRIGLARQGEELQVRAAVAYSLAEAAGLPLEFQASVNQSFLVFPEPFTYNNIPGEALVGASYGFGDFAIFAAAGTTYVDGPGAALARVDAGVRYAPQSLGLGCADTDGDGLCGDDDKCPDKPEDQDGYEDNDGCPDVDNDGDGALDVEDACRDQRGPAAAHGCPDADSDGIADKDDACYAVAGVAAKKGCPYTEQEDRDHDGFPNLEDPCPDQAEDQQGALDGCPEPQPKPRAELLGTAIVTSEKLALDDGSTAIDDDDAALLDAVAEVMLAHPEVKKLKLDELSTAKLTKKQAAAVKAYLVRKGVPAKKIAALAPKVRR